MLLTTLISDSILPSFTTHPSQHSLSLLHIVCMCCTQIGQHYIELKLTCPKLRFMGLHMRTSKIVMLIGGQPLKDLSLACIENFGWFCVVFPGPSNRYETDFMAYNQMGQDWADRPGPAQHIQCQC